MGINPKIRPLLYKLQARMTRAGAPLLCGYDAGEGFNQRCNSAAMPEIPHKLQF